MYLTILNQSRENEIYKMKGGLRTFYSLIVYTRVFVVTVLFEAAKLNSTTPYSSVSLLFPLSLSGCTNSIVLLSPLSLFSLLLPSIHSKTCHYLHSPPPTSKNPAALLSLHSSPLPPPSADNAPTTHVTPLSTTRQEPSKLSSIYKITLTEREERLNIYWCVSTCVYIYSFCSFYHTIWLQQMPPRRRRRRRWSPPPPHPTRWLRRR